MSRQRLNADEDFAALFHTVRRSSWRWECQGWYAVDMPEVQRWRQGLPSEETDDDRAWVDYIRNLKATGIPFQRVRMLTEPVTEYLQWMLATTDRNANAGEDIRWIKQNRTTNMGLPDYDFYIFDDNRVAILRFNIMKELTEVEVDDNLDAVRQHQAWRDLVWPMAIPHVDYLAGHR